MKSNLPHMEICQKIWKLSTRGEVKVYWDVQSILGTNAQMFRTEAIAID